MSFKEIFILQKFNVNVVKWNHWNKILKWNEPHILLNSIFVQFGSNFCFLPCLKSWTEFLWSKIKWSGPSVSQWGSQYCITIHILQNVLKCTEMYWNVLKCTELRNKSPLQLICGRKYESMYCVCWLLVCVLCAATGNIQECFVSHWIDLLQMHQSSGPTQSSVIFGPIKLCPFVSEYQTLNKRSLIF